MPPPLYPAPPAALHRFNDRPSRAGGSDPTEVWLKGIGATKANPINAALIVYLPKPEPDGEQVGFGLSVLDDRSLTEYRSPGDRRAKHEAAAPRCMHAIICYNT